MKRLLAALCVVLWSVGCGMAEDERDEDNKYIYISIPDSAFENVCLAACDLDGDGRVSRYEAQRLLYLDCADAGIRTLAGIEEFTYLRTLDCAGNDLEMLDMSRSPQLERLDCTRNRLVSLNLRELHSLRELHCGDNLLPALDLSDNGGLTVIDCAANRLVTLDVSVCASRIERLDAQRNPELTTVYVGAAQYFDVQALDGHTSVEVR